MSASKVGENVSKIYLVTASINELANLDTFKNSLQRYDVKIVVVDEGAKAIRRRNKEILSGLNYEFYGPKERKEWFKQRFVSNYKHYLSVIPERCHAETSFGFLVAWEEGGDVVIELDDDVFSVAGYDLVKGHLSNLFSVEGESLSSRSHWYNTLENLYLENSSKPLFPRGHPYNHDARLGDYIWTGHNEKCVLNMGLWIGNFDLDALTVLYHGGLNGCYMVRGTSLKRKKVVVEEGTYFPICSMNTAFKSNVIPAFYQLYMKHLSIDRFDDIWSGIFLKKIADLIGDKICLGAPLVYHDKRPRSVFKDLKAELGGMIINEVLWKIVEKVEFNCKDYFSCYGELADALEKNFQEFPEKLLKDFMKFQIDKIRLWLKVIEKLA